MSDKKTMTLSVEVGPDTVRIEDNQAIERPEHISRSRWKAFWQMQSVTGFRLLELARFMSGNKNMTKEEMMTFYRKKPAP